jgi:opacity protein-like surface antigen
MKKLIVIAMVCAMAAPAMAQFAGLPYADSAAAPAAGLIRASAGAVVGDDANGYGGRITFGVMEGLALFADLGIIDPDEGDTGSAYQGGGKYTLPLDLPVDVALRGTLGMASYEAADDVDADWLFVNVGALVSKEIEALTPYGFIGMNYSDLEIDWEGVGDASEDETDVALAGGVLFALNEQLSLYGEIIHIDDLFFGLGGRFQF